MPTFSRSHRTSSLLSTGLLATLLVGGCASGPQLSECDWGRYWADCGGNGAPTLACDAHSGECRVFSGGVVADGYVASDCDDDELCCHPSPTGTRIWAFAEWRPDGPVLDRAREDLALFGQLGVPASFPAALDVALEPLAATPLSIECSSLDIFSVCSVYPPVFTRSGASLVIDFLSTHSDSRLSVVVDQRDGDASAQFFLFDPGADDIPAGAYCGVAQASALAASGTFSLDPGSFDAAGIPHGRLDADFTGPPDFPRGHLTLSF